MAVVNEVVTKFSFKGSLEPLAKFNAGLKSTIKQSALMATALAGATTGAAVWASKQLEGVAAMRNFARAQGVGVEALQGLRYAATQDGGTVEALDASIAGLNQRLGQFAATGAGRAKLAIEALGLSIQDSNGQMRPTVDILKDIAEKTKGMEQSKRIGLAYQLGIDKSLINMLEGGAEGLERLMADAEQWGIISQAQAETSATLSTNIDNLRHGIGVLGQRVAISMIPVLGDLQGQFKALLQDSDSWLNKGLRKIGPVMESAVGAIKRLMPIIVALGAAWAVSFAPMLLTAAAIAAVVLIIDDLIVAAQGGDSVVAKLFDSFGVDIRPILRDAVQFVKDLFAEIVAFGKALLPPIIEFVKAVIPAVIDIGRAIGAVFGYFVNVFQGVMALFRGDTTAAKEFFKKAFDNAINYVKSLVSGLGKFAKAVFAAVGSFLKMLLPDSFGKAIDALVGIWTSFIDVIINLFTGNFEGAWDALKDMAKNAVTYIGELFKGLWAGIKAMFSGLGHLIMDAARAVLPDWAVNLLGGDKSITPETIQGLPDVSPTDFGVLPVSEAPGVSRVSQTEIKQDVTIEIKTDQPEAAGRAVQRGLQDQLQQAQMMTARGGA
jgi:phage-related protein